jgi:hypothetical protein
MAASWLGHPQPMGVAAGSVFYYIFFKKKNLKTNIFKNL